VFDVPSKIGTDIGAWTGIYPSEQRDPIRAAWMEAWAEVLKDWWEKAPRDQKDKAITALKIPTKPQGAGWSDVEAWWNQLSDKEKESVMLDYIKSSGRGVMKWALEDANEITKWDDHITVIDQLPFYRDIPRDSLSADMQRFMDYFDKSALCNIFHLRV